MSNYSYAVILVYLVFSIFTYGLTQTSVLRESISTECSCYATHITAACLSRTCRTYGLT